MKKKFLLAIMVLVLTSGSVFAQTSDFSKDNVSLQFSIIGAELSYERIFTSHLSALVDVSYSSMFFMDEFTASIKGRFYPFAKTFYLDLGLGYSYGKGVAGMVGDMVLTIFTFGWYLTRVDLENDVFRTPGFLIQPGLGWKIDIGKPDAFVLPISAGVDIKLGKEVSDFMPYLRVGVGYSF